MRAALTKWDFRVGNHSTVCVLLNNYKLVKCKESSLVKYGTYKKIRILQDKKVFRHQNK